MTIRQPPAWSLRWPPRGQRVVSLTGRRGRGKSSVAALALAALLRHRKAGPGPSARGSGTMSFLVWLKTDGSHWFRWGLIPFTRAIYCSRRPPVSGTVSTVTRRSLKGVGFEKSGGRKDTPRRVPSRKDAPKWDNFRSRFFRGSL